LIRNLIIVFVLFPVAVQAQFLEFGGGLGSMYYTGDISSTPQFSQTRLAGTAIYRMNLSQIVSFKLALTGGQISANDGHPRDALARERNYSFKQNLLEFSSVFEYHFLNYRPDDYRSKWAPYAFLGFGVLRILNPIPGYKDYKATQPVIPMGAGVKYVLSKRLTLSGEIGARKTFFDYLDGISDGDIHIKNYQFGNPVDKDWYFFTGISLTYVLYKIPCPFPYVPNRSIINKIRGH